MSRLAPCRAAHALVCASLLTAGTATTRSATPAQARLLPRGVVVERVPCSGAAEQSFAAYLPSSYSEDRRWPILYAFDPGAQGARPVRLAVAAAERFGWIVVGSNNSRNGPMAANQVAVVALLRDTEARFPIDPRRVYATGFSGGARVATALALGCSGCFAGVFAQGAGLPNGTQRTPAFDFAWFAAAGERDMNFAELYQLEQELERRGARQRLRSFAGGHEWAPSDVWSEAFGWFELVAMSEGRRPRDAALAVSLFERATARAADFHDRDALLDEVRELAAVVRDFDGLADTAAARSRLDELAASSAYRKAQRRERRMIEEQLRIVSDVQAAIARLEKAGSDDRAQLMMRAIREANGLARGLAGAGEPDKRLVYERALSQAFVAAMETARGALREKRSVLALALFEIAATLRPASPAPHVGLAQAQALSGHRADAVKSLLRATELGLSPAELRRALDGSEALAGLRDAPELVALLGATRDP